MDEESNAYIDKLHASESDEKLLEKVKQLDHNLQKSLIRDILRGKNMNTFAGMVKESYHTPQMITPFSRPEDIALSWLIRIDDYLIDAHQTVIEKLFKESYLSSSKEGITCYNRLKLLIDQSRKGVSIEFLEGLLEEEEVAENPKLESEIYLFLAKLKEQKGALRYEDDLWQGINIKEKPWLVTPILYIARRLDWPLKASLNALWEVDEKLLANNEQLLIQLGSVRSYIVSYLRQSLYAELVDSEEQEYSRFISYQNSLKSNWVKEVLEEVLDSPAMDNINKKLANLVISSHQSGRKQTHTERLQRIEKSRNIPE